MKAEESTPAVGSTAAKVLTNPDELNKIVSTYSTTIGLIANDLGVATNEFIKTDAGKVATITILYTVFGEDLKGFIFSPIISIVFFLIWKTLHNVVCPKREKTIEDKKVITRDSWEEMSEGQAIVMLILSVAMVIVVSATLITGLLL